MPWNRESDEEYDDGYTRESFERAEEDTGDDDADELALPDLPGLAAEDQAGQAPTNN